MNNEFELCSRPILRKQVDKLHLARKLLEIVRLVKQHLHVQCCLLSNSGL